jgi:hypothetical protein
MRHLKILSLAAITCGVLACIGASAASATTLFTDSAKTVKYTSGSAFHATLVPETSSRVTAGGTEIATCSKSTFGGSTSVETHATITIKVSKNSTEGCSQTTHTVALGELDIEYTSGSSAKVTGTGNSVTAGIFGISCTYGTGAGTVLGTLSSGSVPILKINATITRIAGGFLCASNGTWEAEYVVTDPHALYVGA